MSVQKSLKLSMMRLSKKLEKLMTQIKKLHMHQDHMKFQQMGNVYLSLKLNLNLTYLITT